MFIAAQVDPDRIDAFVVEDDLWVRHALLERIPGCGGPSASQGVSVEVGERQAAVDLDVVVEYGVAIADVAEAVRRNVITAVSRMTGLEVTEVNVSVDDIHVPGDDAEDQEPARVQ